MNLLPYNEYNIRQMVKMGKSRVTPENRTWIGKAITEWRESVVAKEWYLPDGAHTGGVGCGGAI